ncbi:MAG TPA: ROK family protein [Acidimicrobiales bacterium]|nr:ROK family protein [Acidimicrobiales bacterium]
MSAAADGLVAGVDVGGTKVLGVLVDPDDPGTVVGEHRVPTPAGAPAVLDAIAEVVRELDAGPASARERRVTSVGVGIAGLVDRAGVLRTSPNLPGMLGVAVGEEVDRRLGLPVRVDNDATCAAWAEFVAGAARDVADAVCVTLGTGIGAGLVADGELVRGGHGFAGEAGHMVVDPNGPPCPCGRHGCWERFASGSGLAMLGRQAAEAGRLGRAVELAGGRVEELRGEHVTAAAAEGDAEALAVLATFADWVALGLANLVTLLDSSLVVLGGGLIEAGDLLLGPVHESFARQVMAPGERPDVRVVGAALGERAGAIGAALLGAREAAARS